VANKIELRQQFPIRRERWHEPICGDIQSVRAGNEKNQAVACYSNGLEAHPVVLSVPCIVPLEVTTKSTFFCTLIFSHTHKDEVEIIEYWIDFTHPMLC
jgi:hypothetical protein